jgi:Na+/proline symporter
VIFWTLAILFVYLVIILGIGFWSGRGAGRDSESFFVANRHLNWLQEAMAVFTTAAPAGALLGTTGLFYRDGANMVGMLIGYAFLMPLTYWFVGSRMRRLGRQRGYQTQAAFLGDFYSSRYLRWGAAIAGVTFSIPYFMVNPVALGILLHQTTGIPFAAGVLFFVVVSMAYCMKGGLRAVADTDIFHGFLLIGFFILSVIMLIMFAGGWLRVMNSPLATVTTHGPGMKLFFSWICYQGVVVCCWPDRSMRMFAVRDDKNMRKGVILSGVMLCFACLTYLAIGLSARAILPAVLKNTDTTFATALTYAAPWLVPWFVMNAWGGGMSNFTAGMLSVANIFIKDLFEPWYVRRTGIASGLKHDKTIMLVTRWWMVFLALITLGVCFAQPPFLWNLINLTLGLFLQFAPLFIFGLFWKGSTRLGAQVSWTAGWALMLLWSFGPKPPIFGPLAGLNALIVNAILFVVVSLLFPEKAEAKVERDEMRRYSAITDEEHSLAAMAASPAD